MRTLLRSTRGVGQYAVGEAHRGVYGRMSKATDKGIVWLTGSHSLADAIVLPDVLRVVEPLADARFRMLCGDIGQTTTQGTFGNDTARTRAGQLRTHLQTTMGAASGEVHLWGGSGGGTAAIAYARQNPGNVASIYLVAPLVALAAFYASLPVLGITQAEVNKAYNNGVDDGGTAFNLALPTHDPSASGNQAALAGIPIRIAYSTDDPAIPPSTIAAYAALVNAAGGSVTTVSQGAVGHSSLGVDPQDVVEFFLANS